MMGLSKHPFINNIFRYSGPLRRYKVTPKREIPDHIKKPDYHKSGQPLSEIKVQGSKYIPVYDDKEIEGIRAACVIGRVSLTSPTLTHNLNP